MAMTVYTERRKRFFDAMQDGVAILRAAPVFVRNNDVDHPYRQDSDFQYLTGFDEPEAYAVLEKSDGTRKYTLFVRPADKEMEVWTGRRAGPEGARRDFGADEAFTTGEFFDKLPALLDKRARLYLAFGRDAAFEGRVTAAIEVLKADARKGSFGPWELLDPRAILWDMRLIKTPADLARFERACDVTASAFRAGMRAVVPGMCERELAAVVEFEFRRRGSERVSFETICAAGASATTLHYIRNDATIRPDDLVLVDAGCELDYVSADVTRTFPASGRFTEPGLTVYRWVLRAQEAAIAAVRPGATYAQVHEAGLKVLCRGLIAMGVCKGTVKSVVEQGTYRPFFMHRIGHWLGADVHDVGPYFVDGKSIPLRAGMVITIEPGLYFGEAAPKSVRGIGVRIEDDVLVADDGPRILTAGVPKEPEEIEALMRPAASWWKGVAPATVSERDRSHQPAAARRGRGKQGEARGVRR
jgi:Xaa-Pro aminopeptidase